MPTKRSTCANGGGRKRKLSTTVKTAAVAPIPRVRVDTATSVNPVFRRTPRSAQTEVADEILRADGERGRRYRAEWLRRGVVADRLDVSVTDPSSADEEQGAHERVLQRTTGDGVVHSIEQANEVINRYEQEAASQERDDPREAMRKAMADHPGTLKADGRPNAPHGATRRLPPELSDNSNREPDRTNYSYE